MADQVSALLYVKASVLRDHLQGGNGQQIMIARDQLRAMMVAQRSTGYWQDKPEKLRLYMDLLYRCDRILATLGPRLALTKRPDTTLHNQIPLG